MCMCENQCYSSKNYINKILNYKNSYTKAIILVQGNIIYFNQKQDKYVNSYDLFSQLREMMLYFRKLNTSISQYIQKFIESL